MIRRALIAAVLLAPLAAAAQPAAGTRLRLSEEGSVKTAPDELRAALRVEVRAATAEQAQEQLNRRMAAAVAAARAVSGTRAETGAYGTSHDTARRQFVAQQSLLLRGGEAVLGLVARLQADGLQLDQVAWTLSDAAARTARDAATREAIRAVQARAEAIAGEIGQRVEEMRELSVEVAPMARPMMAARAGNFSAAASGPTAPTVTAEEVTTTARVAADFQLSR